MQSPILVFDHINKAVAMVQPSAVVDKKLAEVEAAQRKQISTGGGRPAP